jgi:hypothetical protein
MLGEGGVLAADTSAAEKGMT